MTAIGFDIDGVVYPWQEVTYRYLLDLGQTSDTYEEFWNTGMCKKNAMFQHNITNDPLLIDKIEMHYSVVAFFKRIREKHQLYFISHRPNTPEMLRCTERYFRRNRVEYDGLFLDADKPYMVRSLSITHFAEDRSKYALELKNLCNTYLVTQPWNYEVNDRSITRITNILEMERYL